MNKYYLSISLKESEFPNYGDNSEMLKKKRGGNPLKVRVVLFGLCLARIFTNLESVQTQKQYLL